MLHITHPVVYNISIFLLYMSNKNNNNIKKNLAIALCFVINALHYLTVHI